MGRVLIVSNRLPITVRRDAGGLTVERSSGGLATGLKSVHEQSGGLWFGWPGFAGEATADEAPVLAERYQALQVCPVSLTADEVERYYEGYCNGVLWPLFHSFPGKLPLEVPDFPLYQAVNERFAEAVVAQFQEGDRIWVHDYQLMLLPKLLRERLPSASIGFFLHIPFPPSDTFRTAPAREELLEGLLGADLVGFHTAAYMRHFASSVLHVLGASTNIDTVNWKGRSCQLGVYPMGIDARAYDALGRSPEVSTLMQTFQGDPQTRLLVGIDRLDYTKGIARRLLAYERLLLDHPELHGKVRLVQVAVPSRVQVDAYADFRQSVDALIGRITGHFATPSWSPVHYVYRNLSEAEVVALYRAAEVLLVTPIRDGMNLVAKEFVASRVDDQGVLVLSEFAGAAAELGEAIQLNPYDIERSAQAYFRALSMPEAERRTRMKTLRRRVFSFDVAWWSKSFLDALSRTSLRRVEPVPAESAPTTLDDAVTMMRQAKELMLLLDYDGTLVPIEAIPDLARPDAATRHLLTRLSSRASTQVHIVSGRGRDVLEGWLGDLPVALHAEHGFWSRAPGQDWVGRAPLDDTWRTRALEILNDFAARTPGSLVEEKRSGLAFHYRLADREYGPYQANELRLHLTSMLANSPVEVVSGSMVVELRPHGADKGQVVKGLTSSASPETLFAAFGDDRTDEDLFRALPPGSVSVHVGSAATVAALRVASVSRVHRLLSALVR